jgi:hypothetical protein
MMVLSLVTQEWCKRDDVLDKSMLSALKFKYAVNGLKTRGLVEVQSTEDFLGKTWWLRKKSK